MIPGAVEILIVLVIVGVIFGAGKLPQVMEAMGHGVKQFKDASEEDEDAPDDERS
jgi:sec-independent protein translocase protein TatA